MGCGEMTERVRSIVFHVLSAAIVVGSAVYGVFVLASSYVRFGYEALSLGKSLLYYFARIFGLESPFPPTANTLPPNTDISILPGTPAEFESRWARFAVLFVSLDNFGAYSATVLRGLNTAAYFIMAVLPAAVLLYVCFSMSDKTIKRGRLKDSRPLRLWKSFSHTVLRRVVAAVKMYIAFIKEHKPYRVLFILVWAFGLNLSTIVVGFFAFYFYFASSFDFVGIYTNLVRLFSDLRTVFTALPFWVYIIAAFIIFDRIRKRIALDRLRRMELCNRGFLNSLPVAVMFCGTMGKGKTVLMTDAILSRQATFRDVSREKLTELQMQFPDFPWLNFERELIAVTSKRIIVNLASCREYIRRKAKRHCSRLGKAYAAAYCWGYDVKRYSPEYDDKLAVKGLWEQLEIYAQLFFIYTVTSSIIASNYSIRDDSLLAYNGNFPLWNSDFICRDSRTVDMTSRYSHIIDFDAMRLNKQVRYNNPHTGSFEFGVVAITEVGKERGNQNDTKGVVRMTDREANRLNDGFNRYLKMCRHAATVAYYPFISVYMDDQRPQSLNADAKELCSLVHIRPGAEQNIAIPFFWFGGWLYSKLYSWLVSKYISHRFRRSDRTLGSYFVHKLASALYRHYTGLYNMYGYKAQKLGVEDGVQDGNVRDAVYYIVNKKIYAKRFDTACFADVFAEAALNTAGGVDTYAEYATVRASWSELEQQHSYFIDEIDIGGRR